jgi:Bacteriophage head to tail connecting protein
LIAEPNKSAVEIVKRADKARSDRANFDRQFEQIARYVLPRADNFVEQRERGARRGEYVFDSTAQLALPSFAAAIESLVIPRTQKYHGYKPSNPALLNNLRVMTYLEQLRDLTFRLRYSAKSNFASQASEVFMSLGAFGTGGLLIEDGMSRGILYRSIPLSELWLQEDAWGFIDGFFWRYKLTCRQAMQKWPDGLPENITKFKDTEPDKDFEFIFHVCPNDERIAGNVGHKGMRYCAYDICVEGKTLLRESGYRAFPLAVSRYTVAPGEIYGRSPSWDALADIRTLNEMAKTSLRYGQLVTDPPWLTADVDSMSPFSMRPGAINAGFMNERGEVLAKSASPNGDPRFSLELMDQRRQAINRSFLVTLFQILVETPEMTATEAMLRAQEKGALLAPTMGRQQSEFLGTVIVRELDIMAQSGVIEDALGPMPEELENAGGALDIEYDSPLTRAQRAEEGVGVLRTLETVGTIAQYDEGVLGEINYRRALKTVADANGAPLSMFNSPEEKAALAAAKQQQQDLALALQAAPVIADTAKTAAEAQQASTAASF